MSDIQPGDVVVCVDDQPQPGDSLSRLPIIKGLYYRVSGLDFRGKATGLFLDGVTAPEAIHGGKFWLISFLASRFRKIRPADPEFIELVKRHRIPRKVGEPA